MKSIVKQLLFAALIICAGPSCRNNKKAMCVDSAGVQIFRVKAKSGGLPDIDRSIHADFPPDVFLNALNQQVSGNVDVRFQELYSSADMITAHSVKTIHRILASNEFYIKAIATQNGLPLHIKPHSAYCAALPFDSVFGQ